MGRSCSFTSSYSARKAAAATHSGRPARRAERRERTRIDTVFDRPHEQVAELGAEASERSHLGRQRVWPFRSESVSDAAVEELADDLVVLGAGEQRDRRAGVGAHELECDGVGRAGERAARRHAETHRERVAQRRRCGAGRRDDEHLVGGVAEPLHPVGDELDRERRLAGAGRPEDRRVLARGEPEEPIDGEGGGLHARNVMGFRRQ